LFPVLPRTREAWVVVAADFVTSAQECGFVFKRARLNAGSRLRARIKRHREQLGQLATRRAGRFVRRPTAAAYQAS
jgi:hypothetical protein